MLDRNERNEAGFYERTEAFNFLKGLLNIPNSARINRKFFQIFFRESHDGFYLTKPQEVVEQVFKENNIAELNKQYFEAKSEDSPRTQQSLRKEIMRLAREGMAKERPSSSKDRPYFVKNPGA